MKKAYKCISCGIIFYAKDLIDLRKEYLGSLSPRTDLLSSGCLHRFRFSTVETLKYAKNKSI